MYSMKRNGQGADPAQEKLHHAGSIGAAQFLWNPDRIFNAYYGAAVFGVCSDGSVLHWSALSLILKKKFLFCAIVYSCSKTLNMFLMFSEFILKRLQSQKKLHLCLWKEWRLLKTTGNTDAGLKNFEL